MTAAARHALRSSASIPSLIVLALNVHTTELGGAGSFAGGSQSLDLPTRQACHTSDICWSNTFGGRVASRNLLLAASPRMLPVAARREGSEATYGGGLLISP